MPRWGGGAVGSLIGPAGGHGRKTYNSATGGTVTTVSNYNGTGKKYQLHTFTANGTFTLITAPNPMRVLIVDGGDGGIRYQPGYPDPGPGANGGAVVNDTLTATTGAIAVTVGGGGGGTDSYDPAMRQAGGNSSFGSYLTGGGSASVTTTITGTSLTFAGNGYGIGGSSPYNATGNSGQSGVVIIAYEIAP